MTIFIILTTVTNIALGYTLAVYLERCRLREVGQISFGTKETVAVLPTPSASPEQNRSSVEAPIESSVEGTTEEPLVAETESDVHEPEDARVEDVVDSVEPESEQGTASADETPPPVLDEHSDARDATSEEPELVGEPSPEEEQESGATPAAQEEAPNELAEPAEGSEESLPDSSETAEEQPEEEVLDGIEAFRAQLAGLQTVAEAPAASAE